MGILEDGIRRLLFLESVTHLYYDLLHYSHNLDVQLKSLSNYYLRFLQRDKNQIPHEETLSRLSRCDACTHGIWYISLVKPVLFSASH